jgi:hypothetical protein
MIEKFPVTKEKFPVTVNKYNNWDNPSEIFSSSIFLEALVILNSLNVQSPRSHVFLVKMPQESTETLGVEVLEEDDSVPQPCDICMCS